MTADLTDVTPRRRRLTRESARLNPTLVVGLSLLSLIVLAALAAPLLTSWDPIQQDLTKSLAPPGDGHLLGTDQLGRDVFARLLYGARVDLRVGALAVLFPFLIGATLGLVAGWFGGWFDAILMRLVDMVVAFPFFVLVDRAGVRPRPGHVEHLHRDHPRRLGRVRPDRARRGAGRQGAGVRAGRAGQRTADLPDPAAPPGAERRAAGLRLLHERHRAVDPRDRHARATSASACRRPRRTGAR